MIGVHRGRDREAGYSIEPSGFILTTVLGIVGAFVASWLGQALGWYGPGEGAGLIGAVVGAIVLLIWGAVSKPKSPSSGTAWFSPSLCDRAPSEKWYPTDPNAN
jgi:uncharacterized membrane protein YeaQ/YmgE (transglycosylase-associated protein family)